MGKQYWIYGTGVNGKILRASRTDPRETNPACNVQDRVVEHSAYAKAVAALKDAKDACEESGLSTDGDDLRSRFDALYSDLTQTLRELREIE